MRNSVRPLSVILLCSLSLSAIAGNMCLFRKDDPKSDKLKITDFKQPNDDTIFITYADTDSICRNTLCDIQSGDVLHIGRNFVWKQNGGNEVKLVVENMGGTSAVPLYMKMHIENNPRYVYYLMQAQSTTKCFDGEATVDCKSYIFEAFDRENMGKYKFPENGEFLQLCTGSAQPGSGGGTEPPPPRP